MIHIPGNVVYAICFRALKNNAILVYQGIVDTNLTRYLNDNKQVA